MLGSWEESRQTHHPPRTFNINLHAFVCIISRLSEDEKKCGETVFLNTIFKEHTLYRENLGRCLGGISEVKGQSLTPPNARAMAIFMQLWGALAYMTTRGCVIQRKQVLPSPHLMTCVGNQETQFYCHLTVNMGTRIWGCQNPAMTPHSPAPNVGGWGGVEWESVLLQDHLNGSLY